MTAYNFTNTQGNAVSTVGTAQVDTTTTSIALVGPYAAPYGLYTGENFITMLENFNSTTAPNAPMEGQLWNDPTAGNHRLWLRHSSDWVPVGTGTTSSMVLLKQATTAVNVSFATVQSVVVATISDTVYRFHPTGVLLAPHVGTSVTATTSPTFNLSLTSTGDILPSTPVTAFSGTQHSFYTITGNPQFLTNGQSINLNITVAATGGTLAFNVYVFAFMTKVTGV